MSMLWYPSPACLHLAWVRRATLTGSGPTLLCRAPLERAVMKMMVGLKVADTRALGKMPGTESTLYEWCLEAAGFVPYYLRRCSHAAARNALAWAFLMQLNQGSSHVSSGVKQVRGLLPASSYPVDGRLHRAIAGSAGAVSCDSVADGGHASWQAGGRAGIPCSRCLGQMPASFPVVSWRAASRPGHAAAISKGGCHTRGEGFLPSTRSASQAVTPGRKRGRWAEQARRPRVTRYHATASPNLAVSPSRGPWAGGVFVQPVARARHGRATTSEDACR